MTSKTAEGVSTVRALILGVGMGPQHVTPEVATALRSADYVLTVDKGEAGAQDDNLLAVRRAIVAEHAASVPIVAVADPVRDRSRGLTNEQYGAAVAAWHTERAGRFAEVLRRRAGTVAFLVWGDPSMYDSTIRIVDRVRASGVDVDVTVLPGISAPQVLAARHRVVLHDVGRPVHVTTGRRLQEAVSAGLDNVVAMLNPPPEQLDLTGLDDWSIWWGANLGARGERLVHGRVGEAMDDVVDARAAAKAEAGWVMDLFLVRRPA